MIMVGWNKWDPPQEWSYWKQANDLGVIPFQPHFPTCTSCTHVHDSDIIWFQRIKKTFFSYIMAPTSAGQPFLHGVFRSHGDSPPCSRPSIHGPPEAPFTVCISLLWKIHHFCWEKSQFHTISTGPFSIAMSNYQRVGLVHHCNSSTLIGSYNICKIQ